MGRRGRGSDRLTPPGADRRAGSGRPGTNGRVLGCTSRALQSAPKRARSCPLAPIDWSPTDGTSSEGSAIHRPLHSNRHVVALLSSLWPGLGQLVLGARRAGWLLAAPPLILLGLIAAALATRDKVSLLALFLDPSVIAILLGAQVALLAWRLLAVGDAFRRGSGAPAERGALLTAIALVFVIAPSAFAGYLTEVAREAATTVFAPTQAEWD